jgi:hypothetical protein
MHVKNTYKWALGILTHHKQMPIQIQQQYLLWNAVCVGIIDKETWHQVYDLAVFLCVFFLLP